MAVLALVGTLAMNAYSHRETDIEATRRTRNFAAPAVPESTPMREPTADPEPVDEIGTKAASARPQRRHSRPRPKPSQHRDPVILDPWK